MGVIILGKMMQNYSFDIFLVKLPPEVTPNDPPTACYNNLEIIQMVFKSLDYMSEVHY